MQKCSKDTTATRNLLEIACVIKERMLQRRQRFTYFLVPTRFHALYHITESDPIAYVREYEPMTHMTSGGYA